MPGELTEAEKDQLVKATGIPPSLHRKEDIQNARR